ncbi:hypothetical protein FGO68_gene367 [Halteria grandinella]|uniref:Uncharacterized protein n=1 Tax=Halteria grandinella TaxID=5974 RepID=A0A8J8NRR0_HALGN|nr:hypothetical protein FGO68_gene367 [Halteria grandinella]
MPNPHKGFPQLYSGRMMTQEEAKDYTPGQELDINHSEILKEWEYRQACMDINKEFYPYLDETKALRELLFRFKQLEMNETPLNRSPASSNHYELFKKLIEQEKQQSDQEKAEKSKLDDAIACSLMLMFSAYRDEQLITQQENESLFNQLNQ